MATIAVGVAAGVAGTALTLLLHLVQHIAFGYTENTFLVGVEHASSLRRVAAVGIGALLVGSGWWWQRRHGRPELSVTAAVSVVTSPAPLPVLASTVDAMLQVVAVGVGASLGREGAPRQVGAALGGWLARRIGVTAAQQRCLLACGAGAGLAAVYDVPLGGALFTLEILLNSMLLIDVAPALLTAAIATVVAWPLLGNNATYQLPAPRLSASVVVWSVLVSPLIGCAAMGFQRVTSWARLHAPDGWRVLVTVPVVFTGLGVLAIWYPQLLGNGRGLAQIGFDGTLAVGLAAVLAVLKPVVTAACLRAGAIGGLLTPALATGAALGACAGGVWNWLWPGGGLTSYALIAAAAMLAAVQRAPLTALVLTIEFTHTGENLFVPMTLAVALATLTNRWLSRAHCDNTEESTV